MDVPFHMGYVGLICSKAFQSDRPKWGGMYADARWTSLCKTVSKTMLESDENRRCLSSQTVTWLFLGVWESFIPHLKEDIQGYLLMWKQELPQLSGCHLAVCWSWASYHTSSERGHPWLSADVGMQSFDQLIGILWPYFGVYLGSANHPLHFGLSLCNLLVQIRLPFGIWKERYMALIWGIEGWDLSTGCRVKEVIRL